MLRPLAPERADELRSPTIGEPGNPMQAMTRGTVREAWTWTHHPAWYKEVMGRDPAQALEEARKVQAQAPPRSG